MDFIIIEVSLYNYHSNSYHLKHTYIHDYYHNFYFLTVDNNHMYDKRTKHMFIDIYLRVNHNILSTTMRAKAKKLCYRTTYR